MSITYYQGGHFGKSTNNWIAPVQMLHKAREARRERLHEFDQESEKLLGVLPNLRKGGHAIWDSNK